VGQAGTEAGEIEGDLRHYERLPEVEEEISALPKGVGVDFRVAAAQASAPETVVHGIRRLRRAGDNEGVNALLERVMNFDGRSRAFHGQRGVLCCVGEAFGMTAGSTPRRIHEY
jgi:hypothetical protein